MVPLSKKAPPLMAAAAPDPTQVVVRTDSPLDSDEWADYPDGLRVEEVHGDTYNAYIAAHKEARHHHRVDYCAQKGLPVADMGGPEHPLSQQKLGQQHGQGQSVVPGLGAAQRAGIWRNLPPWPGTGMSMRPTCCWP